MNAYSSPLMVPANGDVLLLERVPLTGSESKSAYDEDWLQNLLYSHPQCLPIQELDSSISELVPLCREMPTRAGPVDVVYVTRDGRPVIVEAKLWRNPEARRKIIGQILDYAKELATWSGVDFDAAVRQARQRERETPSRELLDLVGIAKDSPEAARFHDALSRNLERGELLLLIAGDGIREGVSAITDFLEGHGTLHFTFGLIEVAIYRTPDGGHLVQPRVLVQSDIVNRIVVDLRQVALDREGEGEAEMFGAPSAYERTRAFNEFWRTFLASLRLDRADQPIGSAPHGASHYFQIPAGELCAFLDLATNQAGVRLGFRKSVTDDRIFKALLLDKQAIERELGLPVRWGSSSTRNWIMTVEEFPGPLLKASAGVVQRKLADWSNHYVNTFRPRLEALGRELG